jgi:hypothetical protein
MQFEPECEDWDGTQEVLLYRPDELEVWTANQAVQVADTPSEVQVLLEDVDTLRGQYLSEDRWLDIREQLGEGRTVPTCDNPHVECETFDNCSDGTGHERWAYYRLTGEDPTWAMALRHRRA